jgi:hypothetical protein
MKEREIARSCIGICREYEAENKHLNQGQLLSEAKGELRQRNIHVGETTLREVITKIVTLGILNRETIGRSKIYTLNKENINKVEELDL